MLHFYDTSTEPTPAMLEAMTHAELGDDVYHSDPTVNELERLGAEVLGHEAAIFMASGTMSNLSAVLAAAPRGTEVIAEANSHIIFYEAGGLAAVAGAMPRTVATEDGVLTAGLVAGHLRKPDEHYPVTSMVCVENTHNRAGGTVTDVATMAGLRALCDARGLHLHVDGARIFNAAVALGVDVADLAGPADSVSVCLSKGLSAPVGGLLAGSEAFVARARRARKMLGGAMRQAGVVAAAGIVALQTGIGRLAEDHARARRIADGLRSLPGLRVLTPEPVTNFVLVDTAPSGRSAEDVVADLKRHGINASSRPPTTIRFVTHRQIGDDEVTTLIKTLGEVMGRPQP
jgi:threonine aldolase